MDNNQITPSEPPESPCIELEPEIALRLMSYTHATGLEFSGVGWVRKVGRRLVCYRFELLNVGSYGYTEIPADRVVQLSMSCPDPENLRLWIHRHPVGNGVPGPHNWSNTDKNTCEKEPLGSPASMVSWAAAVVITPHGWVGRIDKFTNGIPKTIHVPVLPDLKTYYGQIETLKPKVTYASFRSAPAAPAGQPEGKPAARAVEPLNDLPPVYPPAIPRYSDFEPARYSQGTFGGAMYGDRYYEDDFYYAQAGYDPLGREVASVKDPFIGDEELLLMDWLEQYGPDITLEELAEMYNVGLLSPEEPAKQTVEVNKDGSHSAFRALQSFFGLGRADRGRGNRGRNGAGPR